MGKEKKPTPNSRQKGRRSEERVLQILREGKVILEEGEKISTVRRTGTLTKKDKDGVDITFKLQCQVGTIEVEIQVKSSEAGVQNHRNSRNRHVPVINAGPNCTDEEIIDGLRRIIMEERNRRRIIQ